MTENEIAYVGVLTREAWGDTQGESYLGFGFEATNERHQSGPYHVTVLVGPKRHAQWQADRLASGLYGTRVFTTRLALDTWLAEYATVGRVSGLCPACGYELSDNVLLTTVDDKLQWIDTRCAWALGYPDRRPITTLRTTP